MTLDEIKQKEGVQFADDAFIINPIVEDGKVLSRKPSLLRNQESGHPPFRVIL